MRKGDPGDRCARLGASGQNLGLEFITVAAPGTGVGMHRCPPMNRWTPSSRAYPRQARWDGGPLTNDVLKNAVGGDLGKCSDIIDIPGAGQKSTSRTSRP